MLAKKRRKNRINTATFTVHDLKFRLYINLFYIFTINAMEKILYINFNQTDNCFFIGTKRGYQIYNTSPLKKISERIFPEGICLMTMLFKTNILLLVKKNTYDNRTNENKVVLWDDSEKKTIGEINCKTKIKSLFVRKDYITIVLRKRIYIYNLSDLKLHKSFETGDNNKSLCSITSIKEKFILALPTKMTGSLEIHDILSSSKPINIQAHESNLNTMILNDDGTLLATASIRGTLIRIFDTENGSMTKELRRGTKANQIKNLKFNENSDLLACFSLSGTIHLFNTGYQKKSKNNISFFGTSIGTLNSVIPYFTPSYIKSEWAFFKYYITPENSIITIRDDLIIAINKNGNYYKLRYRVKEPEYILENKINIFEI